MLIVKAIRQKPGLCGVASLKMVLDYFGDVISENVLCQLAQASPRQGTSAQKIKKAAQRLGFFVEIKDGSNLDDIKYWLDKKIPVIVDWFSGDEGHYSVAVGLDKKHIYLQDPEIAGLRKMKLADFKRVWFDFESDFMKTNKDLILRRLIVLQKSKQDYYGKKRLYKN